MLIIISLLIPNIIKINNNFVIKDIYWIILSSTLLFSCYLNTSIFYSANTQYNTILALIIPLILSYKNKNKWVLFRVIALLLLLLSDDIFSYVGDKMIIKTRFNSVEKYLDIFNFVLLVYYICLIRRFDCLD